MIIGFDLLVLKYQHKIFGQFRYIRDHDEIKDVAQEAFIKALERYPSSAAIVPFLYRIAINTTKNYLVARNRRPPATDVAVEDAEYYEAAASLGI